MEQPEEWELSRTRCFSWLGKAKMLKKKKKVYFPQLSEGAVALEG
jgi:hypothetical protein